MRPFTYIVVSIIVVFLAFSIQADEIEMLNGNVYKGKILKETSEKVFIQMGQYGTLVLDKKEIKRITYSGENQAEKKDTPIPTPVVSKATPTPSIQRPEVKQKTLPSPPPTPTITPALEPTKILLTPTPRPPDILPGYDAVLFGVVEDVKVQRNGGPWIKAYDGIQLKAGDGIITGKGKVKIKLRGRGEIRLPPNSYLVLKYVSPEGNEVTVEIKGGTVWNNVTPGGGLVNYTVHTPDLTAGVRGTLFKIETSPEKGSRVAVFEGMVETISNKTRQTIEVEQMKAVVVDKQGQISAPQPVDPKEREEWDFWDEWTLEVHSIAVRFPIGGQVIDALAQQHAQDMRRYERIVNETNQRILANREEAKLRELARAFEKFYVDTGVIASEEQGFNVLVKNPGISGWNGPYYDGDIPPKDRWGNEIHYIVQKSPVSGNVAGKVISNGPDGIFSKGSPATDDIAVFVRYYALTPKISAPRTRSN